MWVRRGFLAGGMGMFSAAATASGQAGGAAMWVSGRGSAACGRGTAGGGGGGMADDVQRVVMVEGARFVWSAAVVGTACVVWSVCRVVS